MRHLTRRDVLILLLALSVAPVVFLCGIWKANADRGGQQPAEPFRIAGNFYYRVCQTASCGGPPAAAFFLRLLRRRKLIVAGVVSSDGDTCL